MLDEHCDGYHLDIMDDHFVPNLTWGAAFVNQIAAATTKPLQVHLMVTDPARWIERLALSQKDSFVFHIEAAAHEQLSSIIDRVRKQGIKVGIALKPQTPASKLHDWLPELDEILVMSVEPGFSGQQFLPASYKKITDIKIMCIEQRVACNIFVDGGVNQENIAAVGDAGADGIAAAAALFSHTDILGALRDLYRAGALK